MATSTKNVITKGYHGKFGDQLIFRFFAGRSVISNVHNYKNKVWSKKQREIRLLFRLAVIWAKEQLRDEKKKRYYKKRAKGAQTANNVAIADYMRNMRVDQFDCNGYKGKPGDSIRVMLRKSFGAASVRFCILGPGGVILESGNSACCDDGITWTYRSTKEDTEMLARRVKVELIRGPVTFTEEYGVPRGIQ